MNLCFFGFGKIGQRTVESVLLHNDDINFLCFCDNDKRKHTFYSELGISVISVKSAEQLYKSGDIQGICISESYTQRCRVQMVNQIIEWCKDIYVVERDVLKTGESAPQQRVERMLPADKVHF